MNVLFSLTPKSEVAYLYDDYSLRQALEKMEHYRYSAVPVIDRNGCYVGTLTEGDLLWYIKDHKIVLTSMNQNFVPVIDDKKIFIGIIRRKDIIEYCYNCYKNVAGNEKN